MGFKSKATKANKEKKQDRKPIPRAARGATWNGVATHRKFERGNTGDGVQSYCRGNYHPKGQNIVGNKENPIPVEQRENR